MNSLDPFLHLTKYYAWNINWPNQHYIVWKNQAGTIVEKQQIFEKESSQ